MIEDTITQENEKLYKFTLLEVSQVTIDAGETVDVALRGFLYDEDGTEISSIQDWSKGKNNQLKIEKVLAAGTYVLKLFSNAEGAFTIKVTAEPFIENPPWTVVVEEQYSVPKDRFFTKNFQVSQHNFDTTDENLIVTVEGSADISVVVQKEDNHGNTLDEYRYKFVGNVSETTEVTLKLEDASQGFSKSIPITFEVSSYEIKNLTPANPFVIANGDDITYPLSVSFDAIVPNGSTVKPTCRITIPWNGGTNTIDLPVRQIGDNLHRYKCDMHDHGGNQYYLGVVAHMDKVSLDIGFEDIEPSYETVTAPVFKRDIMTAKATLERLDKYDSVALGHSEGIYVIVNKRYYSSFDNTIPDIIYLGGENALHGVRKFNQDTVFLQGGIWKLTYGGHEVIIETQLDALLGLGKVSSQLAFTVDGSSDLTQNPDVVKFIIDPESTYRMLVNKSPLISRMRGFLSSGTLWQRAAHLNKDRIFLRDCEISNSPLSVSQAVNFESHPCVHPFGDADHFEDTVAGVRGTTFTIEKKKDKPLVFNLIEGEIELSSTSLDKNITLYDMEFLDLGHTAKTTITHNVLSPLQEKYLEDTSLSAADENTSAGSISVLTNMSNASYVLVGDQVQAGHGKQTVFEKVAEGNYTLRFLPIANHITPEDVAISLDTSHLNISITRSYVEIDTDNDGVPDTRDFDDDNDGYADVIDAFPLDKSEWLDTDHDGIGNNADKDDDNDGISDIDEVKWGFDPLDASDGGSADTDGDGVSNADEIEAGSDPLDASDTKKPKRFVPILMDGLIIMVPLTE